MADLSMGEDLNATQQLYEFKENDEVKQSIDDIDDFERRLNGGATRTASKPAPTKPPTRPAAPTGKKTGADYVKSARKANAAAKGKRVKDDDDDDDDDLVRAAMSDLNRFDREQGAASDDD